MYMGIFPDTQGQLTPLSFCQIWVCFKLIRDAIVVLVTSKNEEIQIKNESARVFTTVYIDLTDPQGQLTP